MSVLGIIRFSLKKYENTGMIILISDAPLTLLILPAPHSSYKILSCKKKENAGSPTPLQQIRIHSVYCLSVLAAISL